MMNHYHHPANPHGTSHYQPPNPHGPSHYQNANPHGTSHYQNANPHSSPHYQNAANPHGISMHKGYAFVQFTNPFDARSACMGEDGRNVFGQILDVNLVAEPKPHQIGKKRPNVAKSSGDWEQFYDSYNAGAAGLGVGGPRLTPPLKRPRMMIPMRQQQQRAQSPKKVVLPGLEDLRTYSSPDILICGNCRELFSNLADFIEHRKQYCKLRFTCKCSTFTAQTGAARPSTEESAALMCALCKENFSSSWDLMVHAQAAHMVNIYQLSTKEAAAGDTSGGSSTSGMDSKSTAPVNGEDNGVGEGEGEAGISPEPTQHNENGLSEADNVELVNGSSSPMAISGEQTEELLAQ